MLGDFPSAYSRPLTAASLAAMLLSIAGVANAQETEQSASPSSSAEPVEEVVVTGFRQSLERALSIKRENVGAVDAILADDIADFPDQNLAESLQRIPGIAITRDSGEGRNISVRGLSGEFTRIRVNGMEAIAATGGEDLNRSRTFDFNVFASELFNSIVVHKTAEAQLDEGSLGAVVDLNTGRPFNYDEGVTFVMNAQMQYNKLNEDSGPRLTSLFSYHDPDGVWGASFSAAYSDYTTVEMGQNTVRWANNAAFRSVMGTPCGSPDGNGNYATAACDEVIGGFHPRIPRYGEIKVARERLGLTSGLQFRPSDLTTVSLDVLYSELDASRGEKWAEVLFRGNEGGMDVTDYIYDPATNNVNMMAVNNAWVRNENFEKAWNTQFLQWGLDIEHDFSDTLKGKLLVGQSSSELDFPYEITFMYDDRDYNGFVYDYRNDKKPMIAFNGPDVTDPSNFQMSEFRDRPTNTKHEFDNFAANIDWAFSDAYSLKAGVSYKKFTFDTKGYRRDSGVCAAGLYDCDQDDDGVDEFYGIPATAELTEVFTYDDSVGAGSTTRWAIPDLAAWREYLGLGSLPLSEDTGNIRDVEEVNTAAYVQLNGITMVGTMDFMFDIGLRYVETDQESTGYNSGEQVTVDRPAYDDFLPSFNTALHINEELIWRVSAAKVMTRPSLGNLTPGGSVDPFNYRVSYQNPYLDPSRATAVDTSIEWYFSEESVLSLAIFYKDIDSRPIGNSRTGTYASTGLPLSLLPATSPAAACPECQPWEISTISNGPGAELFGYEIGFQLPFSVFAPTVPVLSNVGFIGNLTYVDSEVNYEEGVERLFGLSNNSYNATLYYEDDRFNARVSAAYRDDYLTSTSGNGNRFEGYGATMNVDFSAGYAINDHFDVSFEAINLTDNYQDRWTDIDARRRYEYDHVGSIYKVGLKYRY